MKSSNFFQNIAGYLYCLFRFFTSLTTYSYLVYDKKLLYLPS